MTTRDLKRTSMARLAPNPVHADLQAVAPPKKQVLKKKKLVATWPQQRLSLRRRLRLPLPPRPQP
jgi:hypothetical protein